MKLIFKYKFNFMVSVFFIIVEIDVKLNNIYYWGFFYFCKKKKFLFVKDFVGKNKILK